MINICNWKAKYLTFSHCSTFWFPWYCSYCNNFNDITTLSQYYNILQCCIIHMAIKLKINNPKDSQHKPHIKNAWFKDEYHEKYKIYVSEKWWRSLTSHLLTLIYEIFKYAELVCQGLWCSMTPGFSHGHCSQLTILPSYWTEPVARHWPCRHQGFACYLL